MFKWVKHIGKTLSNWSSAQWLLVLVVLVLFWRCCCCCRRRRHRRSHSRLAAARASHHHTYNAINQYEHRVNVPDQVGDPDNHGYIPPTTGSHDGSCGSRRELKRERKAMKKMKKQQQKNTHPETSAAATTTETTLPALIYSSSLDATTSAPRVECVVCFDGPQDAVCVPCGHNTLCVDCGDRIMNSTRLCPVCRQDIREIVKLYRG